MTDIIGSNNSESLLPSPSPQEEVVEGENQDIPKLLSIIISDIKRDREDAKNTRLEIREQAKVISKHRDLLLLGFIVLLVMVGTLVIDAINNSLTTTRFYIDQSQNK